MEEISLKELFDYFKNKLIWIAIAVVFAVGAGNVITTLTRVPMYKSSTTIALVSNNTNSTEIQMNKGLVGTYSVIVKSRRVLDQVISNLGLSYKSEDLSKNISVEAVDNTEIIRITVNDADNKQATKIADEIASVFATEIKNFYKINNVSVVDKANTATEPYNINYAKDNIIYVGGTVVVTCIIIFIMFYFDTTIKTSDEIESKLGLTILGIVPKVEKE